MKASFFNRMAAYIVDMLLVMVCFSVITVGIGSNKEIEKKLNNLTTELTEKTITSEEYYTEYQKLYYESQKTAVGANTVSIVLTIGYFIIFAYLNKGQTIGKKIFNLRVVGKNNSKVKLSQMIIRGLIIYSLLSAFVNTYSVNFLDIKLYNTVSVAVTSIDTILILVTIIFILYNKDKKGLHDILAKTKVIVEKEA